MKVLNTSLCTSCKYRCRSRYSIDSCTQYKIGKKESQGVQMTIYDCINGIRVDTLKIEHELKYGQPFFEDDSE
jgi:hypothetical protein